MNEYSWFTNSLKMMILFWSVYLMNYFLYYFNKSFSTFNKIYYFSIF